MSKTVKCIKETDDLNFSGVLNELYEVTEEGNNVYEVTGKVRDTETDDVTFERHVNLPISHFVTVNLEGNLMSTKLMKMGEAIYQDSFNVEVQVELAPGMYTVVANPMLGVGFKPMQSSHDALIDLPTKEYQHILNEFAQFLKPETKATFTEFGFLYKRSVLLYGAPGTGKTCIVNRLSQQVISQGGVVLFDPNPEMLSSAFELLNKVQPDAVKLVIFEEFDQRMQKSEKSLLSLLDGEIQVPNTLYVATTNYIEKIPERILRPGRFANVIEIQFPDAAAREFYLNTKLNNAAEAAAWAEQTEGLSIDELKETVLAVKCLGQPLGDVVQKFRKLKGLPKADLRKDTDIFAGVKYDALQGLKAILG